MNNYKIFLKFWLQEIKDLGLNISSFKLDHLGYSVSSKKEYEKTKTKFLKFGELIREPLGSNRHVGVFKFFIPLQYENYSIQAVELIEPKNSEESFSGFEHAEFTISISFEDLIKKYPHLNWDTTNINRPDFPRLKLVLPSGKELKFNHEPILG